MGSQNICIPRKNQRENEWIITLEYELQNISPETDVGTQKKRCIYRVPENLRLLSKGAYTPQLTSFGPYHHNKTHLKQMDPYKYLALSNYLTRAEKRVADIAEAMRLIVTELMESYDCLETIWSSEEKFIELMIVDGCFILDLMIWHTVKFLKPYMKNRLWMDMALLENQIPVQALAVLIDLGGHKVEDTKKFNEYYVNHKVKQLRTLTSMGDHHLDIYRKSASMNGDYRYNPYWSIHAATELAISGIHFHQSKTESLKDISFEKGKLKLPVFTVDEMTEPLMLNLLAYEQMHNTDNAITSYSFVMNNLISSGKDVVFLRKKGIVRGWIGSDEDIVLLFHRLTRGITVLYREDCGTLNEKLSNYCNKKFNRIRANFIKKHLAKGAVVLLVISVVQTVFTVLPYFHHN